MKKWLPSLISLGTMALTVFTPAIQSSISSHPTLSAVLAGIFAIVTHILPSPTDPPKA